MYDPWVLHPHSQKALLWVPHIDIVEMHLLGKLCLLIAYFVPSSCLINVSLL